jgi:hypothetical protein
MTTTVNGECGTFGTYSIIYIIYLIHSIIFVSLVPLIIVAIFGYLTYSQMRQIRTCIQPLINNRINENTAIRERDRKLLILVMSESLVYVVTTPPYVLIVSEIMISGFILSLNKSVLYRQIENFLMAMSLLLLYINNTAPFYVYMISSKSFRRDFKRLIINGCRKLTRQPTVRMPHITHQMMRQQETCV